MEPRFPSGQDINALSRPAMSGRYIHRHPCYRAWGLGWRELGSQWLPLWRGTGDPALLTSGSRSW